MSALIRWAVLALALLVAAPALSADALPDARVAKSKRVLVVYDDNFSALGATTALRMSQALDRAHGGLLPALRRQGAQVDNLSTSFFLKSANMTNSEATLWKNLGNTYSLVIVFGGIQYGTATAGATNRTRFYHPDSTNAQLMIVWSAANRNELTGSDTTTTAWPFVTFPNRNSVSGNTTATYVSYSSTNTLRSAFRPYGSTDTLWVPNIGTAWSHLPSTWTASSKTISSVVRAMEPLALTAGLTPYYANADSSTLAIPAAGDSTADATTTAREWLGPAWRVKFASGRYTENVSGQWTSTSYSTNFAMLTYAIAARYLDLSPILCAVEMDDVTDMNPNNTGKRWSNAGYDSLMTRWTSRYGCKPVLDANPLHLYQYIRGEDPAFETAWSGGAWSWVRKWKQPWIHHAHDAVASRPTSNLVGGFGGYSTGNANVVTIGGVQTFILSPRLAFRSYASQDSVYGPSIYHRLAYSDSLRGIACPECPMPPYLSFPDNRVLPPNYRTRTAPTGWYRYRSVSRDSLCPIDSTFLAMARGLKVPSGGTLYIRGTLINGAGDQGYITFRPWGVQSPRNAYVGNEDLYSADSVIAKTPFIYPGEERIVRDMAGLTDPTGRTSGQPYWVRVKNIATVTFDPGSGTNNVLTLASLAPVALSKLLGFNNGVVTSTTFGSSTGGTNWLGDTWSVDPASVYGTGTLQQNVGNDRARIIYFHPGNYAGVSTNPPIGPGDNYATAQFERFILMPVKALNTVAGKQIVKWVNPWEVYAK